MIGTIYNLCGSLVGLSGIGDQGILQNLWFEELVMIVFIICITHALVCMNPFSPGNHRNQFQTTVVFLIPDSAIHSGGLQSSANNLASCAMFITPLGR